MIYVVFVVVEFDYDVVGIEVLKVVIVWIGDFLFVF